MKNSYFVCKLEYFPFTIFCVLKLNSALLNVLLPPETLKELLNVHYKIKYRLQSAYQTAMHLIDKIAGVLFANNAFFCQDN